MSEYTVMANQCVVFPKEVRRRWDITGSDRSIQMADLVDGVLVVPNTEQWAMVEAYHPGSNLGAAAEAMYETYDPYTDGDVQKYPNGVFSPHKVTRMNGELRMPTSALKRWHVSGGGKINVVDLNSGVLFTPKGSGTKPEDIVPVDMLEGGSWQHNWEYDDGETVALYLMEAYRRWTRELGSTLTKVSIDGGSFEGIMSDRDETTLGLKVGEFVVRSALQSAVDNL